MLDSLLYRKHGLFLFILVFLIAGNPLKAQKKPNMIVFISDDQSQMDLGCYGNPDVKTPHMDNLAANGLTFDKFYVASPTCSPNRAALATGRMPSANGVTTNGYPLPLDSVTLMDLLAAGGYRTALMGKAICNT